MGWLDRLVGGFRISAVFQIQSGMPFSPNIRNRRSNIGYGLATERGDLVGDPYWRDNSLLTAGFHKVCISPPIGSPLAGFAARQGVSTGVHDDLFARAPVLA